MDIRKLPDLTPAQVVALMDALLANADTLLTTALTVLEKGQVPLARSLAILGMEESGKAIAVHERRVEMTAAPDGEPFRCAALDQLWGSHHRKLEKVYDCLEEGAECEDALTQLAAVNKAINRGGYALVATGLHQCLTEEGPNSVDTKKLEKLFLALA